MDAVFMPGIELARRYYSEVVGPLLDAEVPGLAHSAALIGWGSDVLGFDSPRSADHNWGPRCQVLVGQRDATRVAEIAGMLDDRLPSVFLGWPTRFPDWTEAGRPVRHWVDVAEFGHWLDRRLGFDPRAPIGLADWLATPTQVFAEITGGAVFHDGLAGQQGGGLHAARVALEWYPDDVWRYVLACQWARIGQEEAFPGRCAETGDELGCAVITARLVRDLIRLTMLQRRRYPPYSKWLGTAFATAPGTARLGTLLSGALAADRWPERERLLCEAYTLVAVAHNELGLTEPLDVAVRPFYGRPYRVIGAERFAEALRASIGSPEIAKLPLAGAVDQFVDSTDAIQKRRMMRAAIAAELAG